MSSQDEVKTPEVLKSKYELTLAEFPVFLLDKRSSRTIKEIEYHDTINGKDGELVRREWRVYPHSKLGLGTDSTFETMFELFQIWKEANFANQNIQFGSIYNLLKRKGKGTGQKEYKRLIRDLNCLVGITIEAKNAFWDNDLRAYVDMTFHLFDRLDLYKETPGGQSSLPFSRIKASDVLYGSIRKNSLLITDIDSKYFHGLKPMEQRLVLYLSKIFRSQTVHKREILEFASQLPIHAKLTKHIKLQIKRACTGLMEKGFDPLKEYGFEKGADGKTEYVVFKGSRVAQATLKNLTARPKLKHKSDKELGEEEYLVDEILGFCQDRNSINFYKKVARLVDRQTIFRALSEAKVSSDLSETKKSKAAHFTYLIKTYAKEQGIEL